MGGLMAVNGVLYYLGRPVTLLSDEGNGWGWAQWPDRKQPCRHWLDQLKPTPFEGSIPWDENARPV